MLFIFSEGSRIIYDRKFLLQMKNSPVAKTLPIKLASIPDIRTEDPEAFPLPEAMVQQQRPKDPTDGKRMLEILMY